MTTITTTCTGCGRQLAVPERYQGRDLKCPGCGHSFRIEAAAPPAAHPAAAPPAPAAAPPPAPAPRPSPDPAGPFAELFKADAQAPSSTPAEQAAVETGPVFWRLTRVGVLSAGMVSAVGYAVLGLVVGIAVAVASLLLPAPAIPLVSKRLLGGVAVVAFPVLYGVLGFLLGAVTAALYNLIARLVGGIKLLLE